MLYSFLPAKWVVAAPLLSLASQRQKRGILDRETPHSAVPLGNRSDLRLPSQPRRARSG